jgi:hypothetical protein
MADALDDTEKLHLPRGNLAFAGGLLAASQ